MASRKSSNMDLNETVDIVLEAANSSVTYSEDEKTELYGLLSTKFPYAIVHRSTLGGAERASLMVVVSADHRDQWKNGILENSRYAKYHINGGKIEKIAGSKDWGGRKSDVSNVQHAGARIIGWAPYVRLGFTEAAAPKCPCGSTDRICGDFEKQTDPKYKGLCNWCGHKEACHKGSRKERFAEAASTIAREVPPLYEVEIEANIVGMNEGTDFPGLGLLGAVGELATYELPSAGELAKLLLKYPKFFVTNAIKDFKDWRNDPMVDIEYLGSQSLGNNLDADFYRHRSRRGATIDRVVATPRGYGKPNSRNVNSLRTVCLYKNWDKWKKKNLNTIDESYIGVKVTKAGKETTKRFKKIDDAVKFVNANKGKQDVIVSEPLMIREAPELFDKTKERCERCLGYGTIVDTAERHTVCPHCDGTGKITVATRKSPRTPDNKIRY